jgi:hypothetical protein
MAHMKKCFHFDSSRERYLCDAAVLWCFDSRFETAFRKFLQRIGIVHPDPIKIAGGAKSLASPARDGEREFVLEQIRTSMQLHATKRVILMIHSDCGAYGGLDAAFHGDSQAEAAHHEQELQRAAAFLAKAIPGIQIQGYFVDFEGVWEAELPQSGNQAIA